MTVAEFAAHLCVSRKQILKWIDGGVLEAFRCGRVWRIATTEVAAFIARNRM